MSQKDLFAEFDPLFSNSPATPADKKMNENDKILDAFGIKKEPVASNTTTSNDNPFADFADLGAQSPAPVNNNSTTPGGVPLNLLMENVSSSKNVLDSTEFPVMSAQLACPTAPNCSGGNPK